jgi:hypothetical protein
MRGYMRRSAACIRQHTSAYFCIAMRGYMRRAGRWTKILICILNINIYIYVYHVHNIIVVQRAVRWFFLGGGIPVLITSWIEGKLVLLSRDAEEPGLCVFVCVCVCVRAHAYVCVRERQRERRCVFYICIRVSFFSIQRVAQDTTWIGILVCA